MKAYLLRVMAPHGAQRMRVGLILAVSMMLLPRPVESAVVMVDLEEATPFALLAGAGITITGPTAITGDMGTYPTPTITGFQNVTLNGINHGGNEIVQQAKLHAANAYQDAAGRPATTLYGNIFDLGGLTLGSGVYANNTSFGLTGNLTLDAGGDANAVWIFQAGSTLTTADDSRVILLGGAQANRIFWQVGTSATLGTDSEFAGSILALESITMNTGATVEGRVLALNGAVTLDHNTITLDTTTIIPEPGSILLLGSGLALLLACRRKGILLVGANVQR
jgi:hypothetical protein